MPLFTREFVSCQANPYESHLYDDPVMLMCGHAFCRSCCLSFARNSRDQCVVCPLCAMRIPFDHLGRFASSLIGHGTLATMVKQYLREDTSRRLCASCQRGNVADGAGALCDKCHIESENLKQKIVETLKKCEHLLTDQKTGALDRIHEEMNRIYAAIDQRASSLNAAIEKYQDELENLLMKQQKANEMNAMKHQGIDIESVAESVEPRLNALKSKPNLLENLNVEKEIKRLSDEADRQLRLLKHKADIIPVLLPPTAQPSATMFGELLLKPLESQSTSASLPSDHFMINASGDTSLQSIPPKLPVWTVTVNALPTHLCVYPLGKSTLIFSCSTSGIISLFNYISPVTYDSPRYIRTFSLFPEQCRIHVQSFTLFNRFMLVHVREKDGYDALYFFTHDGILEHGPHCLSNPVHQYLADENRLWTIDSVTQTISFYAQPLFPEEIPSTLAKCDTFISYGEQSDFIPFRMAINHQLLAVLSKDHQHVYIYNKISCERIFVSQFTAGSSMNVWDIGLFPRDNSLLLKFDRSFDGNVKRSLFIHFNTKNQSVGRIEGKDCLGVAIGPNKEVLVGFRLRTGVIRCYM